MLKILEKYTGADGGTVELFRTNHTGPDFHVRYGLQVNAFEFLVSAQLEFLNCVRHLQECNGQDEDWNV